MCSKFMSGCRWCRRVHLDSPAVGPLRDMPKYALASAFSFCFIIGATAGLHEVLGVSETLSPAIAMAAALVVNFALLRGRVFPGQSVHWGRQFAETVVTSVAFRARRVRDLPRTPSGVERQLPARHGGIGLRLGARQVRRLPGGRLQARASLVGSRPGVELPLRPGRRRPLGVIGHRHAHPRARAADPRRIGSAGYVAQTTVRATAMLPLVAFE